MKPRQRNFLSTVKNIHKALNVWNTRTLTLEGRILIFKKLRIPKIVYLPLTVTVPNLILNDIRKIQKDFLGTQLQWSACNVFKLKIV